MPAPPDAEAEAPPPHLEDENAAAIQPENGAVLRVEQASEETSAPGLEGEEVGIAGTAEHGAAQDAASEIADSAAVAAESEVPVDARGPVADADAPAADAARLGENQAADAPPDPALFAHALRIAEALVFASDRPVTPARLQGALPPGCDARAVLTALAAACAGRPVELVEVAGGFAFRTAPELAPAITRVVEVPRRLPRAAMETLAIVAYHQPVTRAEIEEIRGASLSQSTLELLLDAALIAPRGRKEVPGRPSLWGTTPRFLEQFGLKALGDLPRREELVNEPTLPLQSPPQQPTEAAPPPAA
jgi:segregation and condensation protein B